MQLKCFCHVSAISVFQIIQFFDRAWWFPEKLHLLVVQSIPHRLLVFCHDGINKPFYLWSYLMRIFLVTLFYSCIKSAQVLTDGSCQYYIKYNLWPKNNRKNSINLTISPFQCEYYMTKMYLNLNIFILLSPISTTWPKLATLTTNIHKLSKSHVRFRNVLHPRESTWPHGSTHLHHTLHTKHPVRNYSVASRFP